MNAGKFKRGGTPPYKVIVVEMENENPPPEFVDVFKIQVTASGKTLDKIYLSLKEAELDCEELIKNYPTPW
jgi:hypothetical protein